MSDRCMSAEEILRKLETAPEGKRSFYPFQHGSLRAGVCSPRAGAPGSSTIRTNFMS